MKVKSIPYSDINNSLRLNSDFHLAEGNIYNNFIRKFEHKTLKELTEEIFCAGRSKRIYVAEEFGIPYLGNTALNSSDPLKNCNYVSAKFWTDEKSFLKEGMILTGRVGQNTIGNFSLASSSVEGSLGSDNVIRIVANDRILNGCLYAYLASKYGYHLSRRHISGNAQPFITEEMLGTLPVPIFPQEKQQEIHDLIMRASQLRVEANDMFEESVQLIESQLLEKANNKNVNYVSIKAKSIFSNYQSRLDSPAFMNEGQAFFRNLMSNAENLPTISELGVKVSRPGIFKRVKVNKEKGLPYIKGSELSRTNPFSSCEYLSKTRTPFIEEQSLKENQILLTCAGTVGDTKLISKEYEDLKALGSQDIIRLDASMADVSTQYLYAYLNIPIVKEFIQSLKYGSVIERVEPFHIDSIPVFVVSEEISVKVSQLITQFNQNRYEAFVKEDKAIHLVEKEIAQWDK